MDHQQPVIALLARNLPLGITISGTSIWRKNSAASRQPFWPKSVTHVTGTLSFLCVRSGLRVYMERAMGIEPTSEAWEASILPLYDARSAIWLADYT